MKKYLIVFVFVILVLIVGIVGYSFLHTPARGVPVCSQEAKLCPDGSSVGRQGPNCEFAECPTINTGIPSITLISPSSGPVGTVVTLTGSNFVSGSETYIGISESGQKSWMPDSVSPTQIKFTIPSDLSIGSHNVSVFVAAKQTPNSNHIIFTVTADEL